MDILTLQSCLRGILAKSGSFELPVFPGSLASPWCHPDILIASMMGDPCGKFVFQPLRQSENTLDKEPMTPDLIWRFEFSPSDYYFRLVDFFESFGRLVLPEQYQSDFRLRAETEFSQTTGERCCVWKILLFGCECGTLYLFSEILGQNLKKPSMVMVLNFCHLSVLIGDRSHLAPPPWDRKHNLREVSAISAWEIEDFIFDPVAAESLLKRVKGLDLKKDPARALAILLRTYCQAYAQLNSRQLFNDLAEPLNKCIRLICQKRINRDSEVQENA